MKKLRVLVVDDSLFMRAAITRALDADPRFEVIGQARDGAEAVAEVVRLQPDVVTMDFNMPKVDGVEAVRGIMRQRPTPVVMFSAHTRQGARETFDALAAGAIDFVTKPAGEVSASIGAISDELKRKLVAAATARPRPLAPLSQPKPPTPAATVTATGARVCIVGVSTGGPAALARLVPALPASLRIAIVVVQHMPAGFTATLAERLDDLAAVPVKQAADGDRALPGTVLVAAGDYHLEFDGAGRCRLGDGPPVNGCRPSADVTMRAAARVFGRRAIGVVMTGMGRDGAAGLAAIRAQGGVTFAQDQASSVIFGMPKAAIDAGVVDEVVALDDLAARLAEL